MPIASGLTKNAIMSDEDGPVFANHTLPQYFALFKKGRTNRSFAYEVYSLVLPTDQPLPEKLIKDCDWKVNMHITVKKDV